MKTGTNSCCISRQAGEQGLHPSGRNQPEVEKSATGMNSQTDDLSGYQNQDFPNPEPLVTTSNNSARSNRIKWT